MLDIAKEEGEVKELVFYCTRCHQFSLFGLACGCCKGHKIIHVKMHVNMSERSAFHRLLSEDRH